MSKLEQYRRRAGGGAVALALASVVGLGLGVNPLAAQETGKALPLAVTDCAGCHGETGISNDAMVPHLAGQHDAYLIQALEFYRTGKRHLQTMEDVAGSLSDDQVKEAVAYYSGLTKFSSAASRDLPPGETLPPPMIAKNDDPFAGVRVATGACAGCHGEDGNMDMPGMPRLAGQHAEYLSVAMKEYRDGARSDGAMEMFTQGLSDGDIDAMATFYAVTAPLQATPPATGDPYAGRAAAEACTGCHGESGNGQKSGVVPHIAGLDSGYLVAALKAYKDHARPDQAMRDAVAKLSDETMADLAAFYAAKRPVGAPTMRPRTQAEWVDNCNRCHGPAGNSVDPRFPILAGQSEAYLVKALKFYHLGERESRMMSAMSYPMREQDILDLAAYYASQVSD